MERRKRTLRCAALWPKYHLTNSRELQVAAKSRNVTNAQCPSDLQIPCGGHQVAVVTEDNLPGISLSPVKKLRLSETRSTSLSPRVGGPQHLLCVKTICRACFRGRILGIILQNYFRNGLGWGVGICPQHSQGAPKPDDAVVQRKVALLCRHSLVRIRKIILFSRQITAYASASSLPEEHRLN